jgi:hypothetical protein
VDTDKHTQTENQHHTSCKTTTALIPVPLLSFHVPLVIILFQVLLSQNVAIVKESISGAQGDHMADVQNSENGGHFHCRTLKITELKKGQLPSQPKQNSQPTTLICETNSVNLFNPYLLLYIHTHTHTYTYIYIYICIYVAPSKARNLTSYIYIYGGDFLLAILLLELCISLIYA